MTASMMANHLAQRLMVWRLVVTVWMGPSVLTRATPVLCGCPTAIGTARDLAASA